MVQANFKRYELKYILTQSQYASLIEAMSCEMRLDEYGRHKISNIYYDTEDYKVIRHSLEKPKYKEKLRVRCYGKPCEDNMAFIELKKKFNGIVYKRRIYDKQKNVLSFVDNKKGSLKDTQILNEINYFKNIYENIKPRVYLSYEREAYFSLVDDEFRMTFDFNIKTRDTNISFSESNIDLNVLSNKYILLEVKTVMGLPNWLITFFNNNNIYKTSFSKYGTAYQKYYMSDLINNLKEIAYA